MESPIERAVRALASGDAVAHTFANIYAISARPDAATVRRVNVLKGRPVAQVSSVVTTPTRAALVFEWRALPTGISCSRLLGLMEALWSLGPFGFRGPAAGWVPEHLTQRDRGVRTTQLIAPGFACPSNAFVARCLDELGTRVLSITSANRSHHVTRASEEPAHHWAAALRAEFAGAAGFHVLELADERVTAAAYPRHAPMSTSILAFHAPVTAEQDRPALLLERHGSLPAEDVGAVAATFGFDVVVAPRARTRLPQRAYDHDLAS